MSEKICALAQALSFILYPLSFYRISLSTTIKTNNSFHHGHCMENETREGLNVVGAAKTSVNSCCGTIRQTLPMAVLRKIEEYRLFSLQKLVNS